MKINSDHGSSPRGRGTGDGPGAGGLVTRFIPAWAGNSFVFGEVKDDVAVHPRVGGEQWWIDPIRRLPSGSSPRGRGTVVD